jgi:tetratricopeptide (TPR) repeat protein
MAHAARARLVLAFLLALPFGGADLARAAGGGDSPPSEVRSARLAEYDAGMALVESGDFSQARRAFERAAKKSPRDPEVLNMLAYSQRKSGQLDRAIETYKQALALRPQFAQAREYLGEAYLQAALRELQTLEGYGPEAEAERAQLAKALQEAAAGAPQAGEASAKRSW